ncbi:hypothetical protein EXW27_28730 (plasmid) [Bacillus mycoides]|nr:hypothetical protein EXW27_28730 [Bacillus mycoides]
MTFQKKLPVENKNLYLGDTLNGNFVFFIAPKFIFIILGKNVFLNLIAMWCYPLMIFFLVKNLFTS